MKDQEKELIKKYIQCWKEAGPVLEKLRDEEIRNADTALFVQVTAGMVAAYFQNNSVRSFSGLVDQQRWFSQFRTRSSLFKLL